MGDEFIISWELKAILGGRIYMRILTLLPICCAIIFSIPSLAEQTIKKPKFQLTENFDKALELAQAHDMPLVLIFTAKDWCSFSQKLYEKILLTEEFAEEVNKKFVFVKVDFKDEGILQREKIIEQHVGLKKRYAIHDFPQMVLLDPKGLEIAKLGYSEEIPMEYGKRLVSLWHKYRGLENELSIPKRLSFEKLKEIFIEVKEMGATGLVSQVIDLGLKIDKDHFFLLEAYRNGSKDIKKKVREKLATLQIDNKDQLLIGMYLADFSESSVEDKEKILSLLRVKISSLREKGVDTSKIWAHVDELLEETTNQHGLR